MERPQSFVMIVKKTEKDIFFNYNIICVIQVYVKIPILIIHIKM